MSAWSPDQQLEYSKTDDLVCYVQLEPPNIHRASTLRHSHNECSKAHSFFITLLLLCTGEFCRVQIFCVFRESGLIRENFFLRKIFVILESNMCRKSSIISRSLPLQSKVLDVSLSFPQALCPTISLPFNTTTANGSFAFLRSRCTL